MKVYNYCLKNGIIRTKEFEKKQLAAFAANTGLKCGHGCTYCSTGVMLRTHGAFKKLGVSPFENNYAIIDSSQGFDPLHLWTYHSPKTVTYTAPPPLSPVGK